MEVLSAIHEAIDEYPSADPMTEPKPKDDS